MTIRTSYPHQSLKFWIADGSPALDVWLGYTPVDKAQRQNRTFIVLSVRRPKISKLLDMVWPVLAWFTNRVFAEDCSIVEMEQVAHDDLGRRLESGSVSAHPGSAEIACREWRLAMLLIGSVFAEPIRIAGSAP